MMTFIGRVVDAIRIEIELRRVRVSGEGETWDAAFAEARRRFPADRFQQKVDAIVELQRRSYQGRSLYDA